MKKYILLFLVVGIVFCFLVYGCIFVFEQKDRENENKVKIVTNDLIKSGSNCTLFINEKNVTNETRVVFDSKNNRCIVSLFYITLALGGSVTKEYDDLYKIFIDDEVFTLNTLTNTMTVSGNKMNIIGDPEPIMNPYTKQASSHIKPQYEKIGNDYFIDSNVLRHFLYLLDYELVVHSEDFSLEINKVNNPPVKIIVEGKKLPFDDNVRINYIEKYAEIPLLLVLESIGVEVKKVNDKQFLLKDNTKEFMLDVKGNTLIEKDSEIDIFSLVSGGKVWHYYKFTGDEFYLSSNHALSLLAQFGYKGVIDFESSTIYIKK